MPSLNKNSTTEPLPEGRPPDHRVTEMIRGSSTAFMIRALGTAATVGIHIVVARIVGKEGFGDFSFALAITTVLAIVARTGFGTSLRRYVAQYRVEGNQGHLAGLVFVSLLIVAMVSLSISFIGTWFLKLRINGFSGGQSNALLAAAWLLPPLSLMGVAQAILIGFKRIGPAVLAVQILRPGFHLLLLVCLVSGLALPKTAGTAIRADTLAVSFATVSLAIWIIGISRREIRWNQPRFETMEWLKVSLPLLLINSLQVLFNQTDIIMLGALTSSSETGIYTAAARLSHLVLFGLTAINTAVAPMISELYHSGRINKMKGVMRVSSHILMAYTVVVVLIFVFFGKGILELYGDEFPQAWGAMLILVAGQAVNSLSGPVAYFLTMTGNQKTAARIVCICTVLNLLLNGLFIPLWGIKGAAIATAISVATWNIWMLHSTKNLIGINPSVFRRW